MSEVYKNSAQQVYLDIYGDTADSQPTATYTNPNGTVKTLTVNGDTPLPSATQRYSVVLNMADTNVIGAGYITWTVVIDGDTVSKKDNISIVQPTVSINQIRTDLELDDDTTDEQIMRAERRARIQIETITGEQFYTFVGTTWGKVVSYGVLRAAHRIVALTNVGNAGSEIPSDYYDISEDRFKVYTRYNYTAGDVYQSQFRINDPYLAFRQRSGTQVKLTGTFGWDSVPTEITEAALILIEANLCPDSIYRERYLVSMTAADWRIQFAPGAYASAGNVVADQILERFRRNYTAVI